MTPTNRLRPRATSRTRAMRSTVSSTGPWDSDKRAMSIPASMSEPMPSGDSVAGPMVATIFVRLPLTTRRTPR
jgi:hypothetical protein